jgi:hypothetical protein
LLEEESVKSYTEKTESDIQQLRSGKEKDAEDLVIEKRYEERLVHRAGQYRSCPLFLFPNRSK